MFSPPSTAQEERSKFCNMTPEGKALWDMYVKTKDEEKSVAGTKIGIILEREYGINAMHTGNFPQHWVKPGGLADEGYCTTSTSMIKSNHVLATKQLKLPKFKPKAV